MSRQFDREEHERNLAKAYEQVGRAISAWVLIEDSLVHTLSLCISPGYQIEHDGQRNGLAVGHAAAAGAALNAQNGFSGKLAVVSDALHSVFEPIGMPDNIRQEWKSLHRGLNSASFQRNKFAHWSIMVFEEGSTPMPMLCPSWNSSKFRSSLMSKESFVRTDDARKIENEFGRLLKRTNAFNQMLVNCDILQSFLLRRELSGLRTYRRNAPGRLLELMQLVNAADAGLVDETAAVLRWLAPMLATKGNVENL